MEVKLIFPPSWEVTQPYLSIPSLVGYLKTKGVDVKQFDLNIVAYDTILSSAYLADAIKIIQERVNRNEYSKEEKEEILKREWMNDYILENVERIKAQFRSSESLNLDTYIKCRGFLEYCLELWSLAYAPESIDFGYCNYRYNYSEVKNVLRSIEEKESHIFYSVYLEYIDNIIEDVDLIGFSVAGPLQVIPTFILSSMIKERNPDIKILPGWKYCQPVGRIIKRL